MEKTKEYKKDDITITWTPSKCEHAAVCVKTLPQAYHPKEKPWIKLENATSKEFMAQIDQCPSGALGYYKNT